MKYTVTDTQKNETVYMNRAQRRAAARVKPQTAAIRPVPMALDEMMVFDDIEQILLKITHGQIEHIRGTPVYWHDGEWCDVCFAISSFQQVWQAISDGLGLNICLAPIGKLHNKLHANMPATEADLQDVATTILTLRQVFRAANRQQLAELATKAQIQIYMRERQ